MPPVMEKQVALAVIIMVVWPAKEQSLATCSPPLRVRLPPGSLAQTVVGDAHADNNTSGAAAIMSERRSFFFILVNLSEMELLQKDKRK